MKIKEFSCKSKKLETKQRPTIELTRYQKACANLKSIQKIKRPSVKINEKLEQKFVTSSLFYVL